VKRILIALGLFLATGVMVGIFASRFGKDTHKVPFMLRGQPAPAFDLGKLNGEGRLSLADFKGKPVVLNFWATWCRPCVYEHPVLEWGAREFGDQVGFVGMVFEDNESSARQFLAQHGRSFPQLFDPDSRIAVEYGAAGVPETYFIDAQGIIVDKYDLGPISPEELSSRVRGLLGTDKGAMRTKQP
jgi:cytochrome c biogenesis protein CcmG, thiol:disulfide interchange protein DsbE